MTPSLDILLDLRDARFGYAGRAVVRVAALQLAAGRCLGIFGPNGSGKTTLVRGMTGLLPPLAGTMTRGTPAADGPAGGAKLAAIRFGYLSQSRDIDPAWPMTARDAAALSASARSWFGWVGAAVRQRIDANLRQLGVDAMAAKRFNALSGGQQQRVLLAGALASDPQVLVLDEPTEGLDVQSRQTLLALLGELLGGGLCVVIVSHDVEDLLTICHEVAWLHPPQSPDQPSEAERIAPSALANRLVSRRRVV
jgi:ABC-type Mn2+/Zn2+ transport system ATPase subunit